MSPRELPSPAQTIGPFFGHALPYPHGNELVAPTHAEAITVSGRVLDGAGEPVPDALVELWQAGPDGAICRQPGSLRRDGSVFTGWGRAATDPTGAYAFSTVAPGRVDGGTPFFSLTVFARGLLDRLLTRAYLPGADAARDPFLGSLDQSRRRTLIATRDGSGYRFDIRLQGEDETVFLDHPRH